MFYYIELRMYFIFVGVNDEVTVTSKEATDNGMYYVCTYLYGIRMYIWMSII